MFVQVFLPNVPEGLMLPVANGKMSMATVIALCPGAHGLRPGKPGEFAGELCQSDGDYISIPAEGHVFTVVKQDETDAIALARNALAGGSLSVGVSRVLGSRSGAAQHQRFDPYATARHSLGAVRNASTRKTIRAATVRGIKETGKRSVIKSITVAFILRNTFPCPYSKEHMAMEGQLDITSTEGEAEIKEHLMSILHIRSSFSWVSANDLLFLRMTHKTLDLAFAVPGYEWTGSRLYNLAGQGRLYVSIRTPPEATISHAPADLSDEESLPDLHTDVRPTERCVLETREIGGSSVTCTSNDTAQPNRNDEQRGSVSNSASHSTGANNSAVLGSLAACSTRYSDFMGDLSEGEALKIALEQSSHFNEEESEEDELVSEQGGENERMEILSGIIQAYSSKVVFGPERRIVVSRSHVWDSAHHHFKEKKRRINIIRNGYIKVEFLSTPKWENDQDEPKEEGEVGVDEGGLRREFFRLMMISIIKDAGLFQGSANKGFYLRPNLQALDNNKFFALGNLISTQIVQGGQSPNFFVPTLVDMIMGRPFIYREGVVDELDSAQAIGLKKVQNACTQSELNDAIQECEWRMDVDGLGGLVSIDTKDQFCRLAVQHFILHQPAAMNQQLLSGLNTYKVLDDLLRGSGHRFDALLKFEQQTIAAEYIMKIMKPRFNHLDPSKRCNEQVTMAHFKTFLNSVEDGTLAENLEMDDVEMDHMAPFLQDITMGHILALITGASSAPIVGFKPKPAILFCHENNRKFEVSTCSNEITLVVNKHTLAPSGFFKEFVVLLANGQHFSKA